jgi:hypothetical protein
MQVRFSIYSVVLWCATIFAQSANPVPLINNPLIPASIAPGSGSFTLTLKGTGFVSNSVVEWNGSPRTTQFVSGSELSATILASDVTKAITASITVVNPRGGTSNVIFFPVTNASAAIAFNRSDYSPGKEPFSVATGDFNKDGKLDFSVVNPMSSTLSVFLGHGDGTFQARVDYDAETSDWVTTGDFNRDGNLDLATSNQGFDTVSIFLGNGDGTFQPRLDYPAGITPFVILSADFNGDGKLDLVVSNTFFSSTVSILLGNGDGTFKAPVAYSVGNTPLGMAAGDFNGDGKLDLAVANYDCCGFFTKTLSILLGNGDGTFQTHVDYLTGSGPNGVVTADFNGDGKLDLAVSNVNDDTVSVLLGNGDGTFQGQVVYSAGGNVLVAGDFNGDGRLDLASDETDALSILLGNGDGTFQPRIDYPTGLGPNGLDQADFNNDGRLDLAVPNATDNTVSILLQATSVALSSTALHYGVQLVHTSSAVQTVTLTNSGAITLTITSIAASGDFIQKNNCGSSLAAGASCKINTKFKPTAKGIRTGALTISDNAIGSPQTVKLAGIGTVVQLSPASVNFGNVPVGMMSQPQTITLTNIDTATLNLFGIGISGANYGDFAETTTCGSSLPSGASCAINVTFTPTAKGSRNADIDVNDNGGGNPQRLPLTGTGT